MWRRSYVLMGSYPYYDNVQTGMSVESKVLDDIYVTIGPVGDITVSVAVVDDVFIQVDA